MPGRKKIKIKFEGEAHSVNATTFIDSLSSFITITEEVNQGVNNQESVRLDINAIEPGSFEIYLELITSVHESLDIMFNTGVTSVDDLVQIITGIYTLRKFLIGKKPKEITQDDNSVVIKNENGEILNINANTYNIYTQNLSVTEALNNNFEALNNDQYVREFTIESDDRKYTFNATNDDFPKLTDQDIEEIQVDEKSVRSRVHLRVFKIVFSKNYTWKFIFRGEKINAKILDEKFMTKIEKGLTRFGKGDILEAELEILKKFDESLGAYINKKYRVIKVFNHIPRSEQSELNL